MTTTKDNYLKRQHFFRCDEALGTALKAKQDITSLLEEVLRAAEDVVGVDVQERIQSAVEVALRRHPEALGQLLLHLKTPLPPIFLLTAVYTNKIDLVETIIPYLDPAQSYGLSLEVAAARNNFEVFQAVLPIASDAKIVKILDHVLYHQNEEIFALICPLITQSDVDKVEQLSSSPKEWTQRLEWMRAQTERLKIADAIKCKSNLQKSRKM